MMTDEAEGVTEVVSYLADLHAATPTSSISHGDDHADALLEDSEALQDDNVSQVSLPVNLAAGAEFRLRTKEYTDTDCRRGFQDEFQFCDNTSDQLRQILGKSSYLDSTDEMDDSRTNEHKVREFAEAASSSIDLDIKKHPSSKKGNHRQRDQKQEASHLGMLDGKQPSSSSFVDGNEENEDENLTDMMPRSASTPSMPAEGLQPCETHYPIFRRRSAELRSSVSPTGKLSGGHYGMTGFCGKSSAVPLSRPVSVEAGLAAMGLREEMSPVQGYQSVPLYHRNGSESTLWDQEKEKLQSQLKLSRDAIASLQAENNIIKSKFSKMPGVVQQLKEQLNQSHAKLDYEKHQHLLEVSQMQRKLRFEQEKHEREAEQVFREVVRERDSLKAEVTALNKSVDALKKESNQLKLTAESSLKDHQKSTQATLFALKDELSTVKDILEESENSRLSEQRKHQATSQELANVQKLAVQLKRQLQESQCQNVVVYKGENVEVGELFARLANAEKQLLDLHDNRAADIAAAEARLREENIKLQVSMGEIKHAAEKEKEKLQATIRQHEEKINKLTVDLTQAQDGPRPSGDKSKKQVQYYGRWTAHRAESRKHAEEMKIITTALEKEGYGPNQATVDEVIRYLWWKKERNDIELTETKETLAALGGEEPQQAFKIWKEENESLVSQITSLKEELHSVARKSRITEETLRKEVEELGLDNQHVREDLHVAQGQAALAQEKTQIAKKELAEIRNRITQQTTEIGELKGMQEKSRIELEQVNASAHQEKRHNAVLRSEAVSLRLQLEGQREQMQLLFTEQSDTNVQLASAISTKEQLQKQIQELEAQVSSLQSDSEVTNRYNESIATKCDDLGQQLDEAHAMITTNEAQLTRDQEQKEQLQNDIRDLEKELTGRMTELERYNLNQCELQDEVNHLLKELQVARDRVSLMEEDNSKLASQLKSSAEAIQLTSTDKDNLAVYLTSAKTDLEDTRRQVVAQQQQLNARDRKIDHLEQKVEEGGRRNDEIQRMHDETKADLELFQRKAEEGHVKENFLQTQLAGKEKEVCSAKELVESLRIEMTELLVELHSTRDKIDGAQKEVIAIRGVCQQQSEHIDQLTKQVEITAKELTAAHAELSGERKTVAHLKTECGKFEAHVQSLSEKVVEEGQQVVQIATELRLARELSTTESKQASGKIGVLEGEKGILEGEIKALTSYVESMRIEHEDVQRALSKEKKDWVQEKGENQAEIKELKVQLQTEREAKQDLTGQLSNKQEHIESLTAEVAAVREQLLREKQAEERELRRVLERLQSEALKQQTKHEEQLMKANQAEKQAVARERSLRTELETLEMQKAGLQSHVGKLREQNRTEHENVKSLERHVQEVETEKEQAQQENIRQTQEFTKLRERHDQEIQQLMEQRTQSTGELTAAHEVSQYLTKENDTLQAQVQQLKSQLAEEMKHVKKVKELYQEEVQNLRRKMEQSAQVLRTAQQENKQVQRDYEKKVSHTEARVISLEAELGRKAMESRMAETENVSLKARLEHMSRDLDASLKARGNFEKAIDLEKEKWHKEYASVRDELHCQREKMVTLLAELTEAKANIQALEEEGESVHSSLVCERQANVDVQLQLNEALEEKSATSQQILFLTEEKVSMSSEITQLKQTVEEEQKQSAALRQHLQEAISQVQEEHRVSLTAQSKFNLLLGSLQAEFENDRKTLETERNNLMQQLHGASAELESLQNLVQQAGRKLKAANEELRETTRKKAEALELLEREISLRTELQQQASELGSQVTRCELEMNAMSETVTVTKATNHELQLKLDCAERKCHSLAEQLNEEKAASTMSKAAMGEQHRQLITELETRLMQANSQLGQIRAQYSLTKEELASTSQARQDLKVAVDELTKVVEQLRGDLQREMSQRELVKQQADHYEKVLSDKKNEKAVHVEELQRLQALVTEAHTSLDSYKKQLEKFDQERADLKCKVKEQKTRFDFTQQKLERAENELREARKQLNEQTLQYSNSTKRTNKDLAAVRQQHIEDCRQMEHQIENMSQQLSKLRRELADVESEKALLTAECQQTRDEKATLHTHQNQMKETLRAMSDAREKMELRNEELVAQVALLREEITALRKCEEEMIDYQRSHEASTRADMHHLVAEITQQLEQQYSCRENFHRLRAENETSALQSAKQKVDELEEERRQLQKQYAREQQQCEAMKSELSIVYSQRLQDDKMRKKLESRLERVNEALNRSKAVVSAGLSPTKFGHLPTLNGKWH